MTQPTHIVDGAGSLSRARVNPTGALVTGPLSFSDTTFVEFAVADSAYSLVEPLAGQQFVITGLVLGADKDVGVDGAIVEIYEASSNNTTTVDKTLFQTSVPQKDNVALFGLNFLVNEGKFVNGKTDDDDIHTTIGGYFIPKI